MKFEAKLDPDLNRLNQLVKDSGLSGLGIVTTLRGLASELSAEISPIKNWSWNYLHQVKQQKLPLSGDLRVAIRRLCEKKKQQRKPEFEEVVILAPPGFVMSNSILKSQTRLCARPGCGIRFIANSPNQKFHSPSCRKHR